MGKKQKASGILLRDKKGKPKRLALPRTGFVLDRRGNLTLIHPSGKNQWADDERIFRSLLYDRDGSCVSVGLPKFSSPFKDQHGAEDLDYALRNNEEVDLSRKYDGTLIIRSLIREQAYFRTRNAIDAESYDEPVRKVARERYPRLMDQDFAPTLSLHFEFVSPRTRVVLDYPKDDLILIGGIDNKTLRLLTPNELDELAEKGNLRRCEHWSAQTGLTVATIQASVNADKEHEGLVARWGNGQLLRIKSSEYLDAHRRRFELNPARIFAAIDRKGQDKTAVLRYLGVRDDDPLRSYVDELVDAYVTLDEQVAQELAHLDGVLTENTSLSRARLWQDVGATLPEPFGAALMHLRAKERDKARGLILQTLRKRLTTT